MKMFHPRRSTRTMAKKEQPPPPPRIKDLFATIHVLNNINLYDDKVSLKKKGSGEQKSGNDTTVTDLTEIVTYLKNEAVTIIEEYKEHRDSLRVQLAINDYSTDKVSTDENTTDKESAGKESTGKESTGKESTGEESTGKESTGKESTGKESTGKESTGKESTGKESTGEESTGKESTGKESTGKEPTGKESTGKESTGKESTNRTISMSDGSKMLVVNGGLKGKGSGKTILQLAIQDYSKMDDMVRESLRVIISKLIKHCPHLILSDKGRTELNPLLLAMLMQDTELVEEMLDKIRELLESENEFTIQTRWSIPDTGRILRARSMYHVALLTLNPQMFDIFCNFDLKACIESKTDEKKYKTDNLLHALVRHGTRAKSEKDIDGIIKMIDHLQTFDHKSKIRPLWRDKNHRDLTPLQLAAKKGQHRIFMHIMSIELLYLFKDGDEDCFDVTEIDTIPTPVDTIPPKTDNKQQSGESIHRHRSVLHLLRSHVPYENSIKIVNQPAVKAVVDIKWRTYRWYVWLWFLVHVTVMSTCVAYAVFRADLSNPFLEDDSEDVDKTRWLGITNVVYGIFCSIMQFVRNVNKLLRGRYQFDPRHLSSSSIFAGGFLLFGLLIVLDFGLACTVSEYGNFLLPYALIIGWSLTLYFLQVIPYFSVFVVLIQKLSSITIQFASVTIVFLVGFSGAAYLAMHDIDLKDGDEEVDTFKHFGKTLFKMFTIMIGLGDLDPVFEAEYLILTISIFVLFALLNTILLLNALIAYMSEICTIVIDYQTNRRISNNDYARLQKVSVIVQLEDFLPVCMLVHGTNSESSTISFPYSDRKYIVLRPPKEPEDCITTESKSKPSPPSDPPKPKNKVFPDNMKTLEITEITQEFYPDESGFGNNRYSFRRLK